MPETTAPTPTAAPAPPPAATTPPPASEQKPPEAAPAAPAAPKPDEKPKDSAAERFAALARKEKALVEKQRATAAREQEWAKERETLQKKIADLEPLAKARELVASDPLAAMQVLGLDYDKVTEAALTRKALPPEEIARQVARAEMEAREKAQREAAEKAKAEEAKRIEQERAAALESFRAEVKGFISQNADTYELTALHDAGNLVVQVVEQHYQKTGKVLSTKEAADLVEAHLEEQTLRATATKKLSAKFKPPAPPSEPSAPAPAAPSASVHNGMTASTPANTGPLTWEERRKRAEAAWEAAQASRKK